MVTSKKRRKLIITITLILIVFGGSYLVKKSNGHIKVESVETENVVVKQTVSASGSVISENEASLAFASMGRLEGLEVKKGDKLNKGDFIAYVSNYDSSQTSQAYKDARDISKKDLEIYIESYGSNMDAVGGEDEYYLNIARLKELISKAEASYQSTLGSLNNTYLYAPFDGTIIDTYKEIGEVVSVGANVVKIADLEDLIFEIEVDQEDFGILKIGQDVEITLDSYGEHVFTGVVRELPQYADETTTEFIVRISLMQSEEMPVLLGMKGDASIIVETSGDEVVALTFDTVFKDNDQYYVWTM